MFNYYLLKHLITNYLTHSTVNIDLHMFFNLEINLQYDYINKHFFNYHLRL